MAKLTKEEKQNFEEKLQYLGLDLENIPSFLKEFEGLEYRPSKLIDEKEYVVYRYIDVDKIEILITPTNRLADINEKYAKARPIAEYLNLDETEESIERFSVFLNMLNQTEIQDIEEVENKQRSFQTEIPFRIKYEKNYLWQIYYSQSCEKYFMLVPAEDRQFECFFYLLKKQIESSEKDKKIYVPIIGLEHDGSILKRSQIKDIENYLWLFTKNWPVIYELTNKQNEKSIEIVGQTDLQEGLKAHYRIHMPNEKEAAKFYKQVKALFILQTELSDYYKFKPAINKDGKLEFYFEEENIDYENLSWFIKSQYLKIASRKLDNQKKIQELEAKLNILKKESEKKDREYLSKQREISTYLEYKRTFFGRVKYFFTKKARKQEQEETETENEEAINIEAKQEEEKAFYTIEELVSICSVYTKENENAKNIELDIKALEEKIKNMTKKIENATLYLKEIDSHKKSIFEFWKFTSKDESLKLKPGEELQIEQKHILKRVFEYETDIENVGKQMDKANRQNLSKQEMDALFIGKTKLLDIINKIKNHVMVPEDTLKQVLNSLKEEAEQKSALFKTEEHDIFGGLVEDRTQIKLLNGKKHREAIKDKIQILSITKETSIAEFKETLKQITSDMESAEKKGNLITDMTLYAVSNKSEEFGYAWYHMQANEALKQFDGSKEEVVLIKVNLEEQMPAIYDTNCLYYDNYNKTLPLGMELSDKILLNGDNFNWDLKRENKFFTNEYFSKSSDESNLVTKEIHMYEYDLSLKEKRKSKWEV